jgi:hypothetical protein
VMRGHFGRCTFRARCISATKELMDDNGDNISDGSPALDATAFVDARASGDHISSAPAGGKDDLIAAMIRSYKTRVSSCSPFFLGVIFLLVL